MNRLKIHALLQWISSLDYFISECSIKVEVFRHAKFVKIDLEPEFGHVLLDLFDSPSTGLQNTIHNDGVGLVHHNQRGYHVQQEVLTEVTAIGALRRLDVDAVEFQDCKEDDPDPVLDLGDDLGHIVRVHLLGILDPTLDILRVSLEERKIELVHQLINGMIPLLQLLFDQNQFLIECLITGLKGIETVFISQNVLNSESLLFHRDGAFPGLQVIIHVDILLTLWGSG